MPLNLSAKLLPFSSILFLAAAACSAIAGWCAFEGKCCFGTERRFDPLLDPETVWCAFAGKCSLGTERRFELGKPLASSGSSCFIAAESAAAESAAVAAAVDCVSSTGAAKTPEQTKKERAIAAVAENFVM